MPASSLSELSDRRYPQGSRTTDIRPQSRIRARSGHPELYRGVTESTT
jgi:hypothetical protein